MTDAATMETVDVEAFRIALTEFVGEHHPPADAGAATRDSRVALPIVAGPAGTEEEHRALVAASCAWQRRLFDAGYGWVTGPPELGGAGLSPAHLEVLRDVMSEFDVPDDTLVRTGTQVLGPSILQHGTDHLRSHHLPAIHRGDELVCQLFSEPDAGSDLANIKTLARRDGDSWVLDGQKVWSSGALDAATGLCIARTEPGSERHRGLTAFMISMDAPGVEVRRIRQMTGGAEFCEVFLTGVTVDDDHIVGEVDGGWAIVIDALMNERSSIGNELLPDESIMQRLLDVVRASDPDHGLVVLAADVAGRLTIAKWLERRIAEPYGAGDTPGPEFALTKLALTEVVAGMCELASRTLGASLVAGDRPEGAAWAEFVLGAPGLKIGGGTDEVLKNNVAERILGLPREPAPGAKDRQPVARNLQ
ncbi:MAG: acyl-CoA dehydrogenase family protein [Ilumatobacteraceae bacterium]|nr:acyl-CoA dehydrogenase family protein [Ilumatobacteraceae bacterium]